MPPPPLSRHAAFFASLQRVEDRLASEQHHQDRTTRQPASSPFSDTMTASPLLFLDPAAAATSASSGPALDFLTPTKQDQEPHVDDDGGEDMARLMALLGLSPPRDGSGGCDCSAKIVGPKCDGEKRRLDAWIQHYYHRGDGGGCREPARVAHLLLARASSSWDREDGQDAAAIALPATVKDFLDRDAPPRWTEE